jgi:amino acid adenylation domain-containing protein
MLTTQEGLRKKLAEDYWLAKLGAFAGERTPGKTAAAESRVMQINATLPEADMQFVEKISKGNFWGKYTVFLAAYAFLAGRYFGQKDILIAGRLAAGNQPESDSQPSLVFFGLSYQPDLLLKDLIIAAQAEVTETLRYKGIDLDELQVALAARNISHSHLLDRSFSYAENADAAPLNEKFGLSVIQSGGHATVHLAFDEAQTPSFVASRFLQYYCRIIHLLQESLNKTLRSISFVSEEEQHAYTIPGNTLDLPFGSIVQMFEQRVQDFPANKALSFYNTTYTYAELNHKVNQLARCFSKEFNIGPGSKVGLMVRKSDWIVLGMLAILKTGAAFVPIDPENPAERNRHIIGNASIDLLVLESETIFILEDYNGNIFATDLQADNLAYEGTNLDLDYKADDAAYIMYTSGTTGTPKGVMIEHHSIVNYAAWVKTSFGLTENDSSVLLSSYAFDLGYTSIFGTLLLGGHLHIFGGDVTKHPEKVLSYLAEHAISFIKATPSLFYILTHIPGFAPLAAQLPMRLILLGGEPIKIKDLELYLQHNSRAVFINHYGPTETTIGTAACVMDTSKIKEYEGLNLIGRPALNNEIIILDEHQQPVPAGSSGEICIGGEGLARGYYKSEELTARKFIPHPLKEGKRIYRSGDYGRMLQDGNISLVGRKDSQLKIRGYRIEVAEIEKALLQRAEEVKVLPLEKDDHTSLLAFIKSASTMTAGEWRNFLLPLLPEYMVPAGFVAVEQFPLLPHGKIDAAALLEQYRQTGAHAGAEYIAPVNEVEQLLVNIWQEVLGREKIGTRESFFELGGNSLLIVQANSMINIHYPKVTIADLFAYTNVSSLAAYITDLTAGQITEVQDGCIVLPASFFREFDGFMPGDLESYDYNFSIQGDAYEAISSAAAANEVDVWTMAVSFFFFALSESAEQEAITLQVCSGNGMVKSIRMHLGLVEDETELYRKVGEALQQDGTTYALDANDKVRFAGKERTSVLPFIFNGQLPLDNPMLRNYDLSLGVLQLDGRMEFSFRYDGLKLRKQKMEEFIQQYIRVVESVLA